jgi:N-acyl-D-amino-acid deacylase
MIGSDGIPSLDGQPHPRLYGSFARVLGRYHRELRLLTLEEAVHRMTGRPAGVFGFANRGTIRAGAFADLVLFHPATIVDIGTYDDPQHPPAGIAGVWVNGERVVDGGAHLGARPGRTLRRT